MESLEKVKRESWWICLVLSIGIWSIFSLVALANTEKTGGEFILAALATALIWVTRPMAWGNL